MPKMKTKRAALKRFKLTGTGKIKFKRSNLRHILTKKPTGSKRKKRATAYISDADHKLVMNCLPYGTF